MNRMRGLWSRLTGPLAGRTDPPSSASIPDDELITGIVRPSSATASQDLRTREWSLAFRLDEWRGADGITHATGLVVRGASTAEEARPAMDRINAAQVIRARVRFTDAGRAELLELVDTAVPADDPLFLRAVELARPVVRHDEQFGTLTLPRKDDCWEGEGSWDGDTVQLIFDTDLDGALETARALWSDQAGWSERMEAFAAQELLATKNESWLGDDEEPLDEAAFRARMRLETIHVFADGGFTFFYGDEGLFWDHTLEVSATLRDGPDYVSVEG